MKKFMNSAVRRCFSTGIIALASGMVLGCLPEDDFQDLEVMAPSPKVSLPLLNTSLALSDLIRTDSEDGMLVENPDKSYSLMYRTAIASASVGEFFPAIPEQNYAQSFTLGFDAPAFLPSSATVSFAEEIPMDLDELNLYQIACKQGMLLLTLSSSYEHDVHAKVTFPGIQDSKGKALELNYDLMLWGSNSITQHIPLQDYTIHIDESKLSYQVEITISGSGEPISSYDEIIFDFNMADVDFSYLEGNFSNIEIPVSGDTLMIAMLNNAVKGNISLNPKLKMEFSNSFGVNIQPDFSNIYVSTKSGSMVRLADEGNSNFFSGNFQIPYPENKNETATKVQAIDHTNSNIEDAFAEIPQGITYHFGFMLNSAAGDTSFISDQSKIAIDLQTEIPMEGSFNILLYDTLAVDFEEMSQNLEELRVLIKTENSFPIDASLQVYFLDEQGEMIRDLQGNPIALFEEGAKFLHAATITNTTTGETQPLKVDMPLAASISDSRLLTQARHFLIQASMESSSEQDNYIRLYSFYNIRFSMAMQMKASLQ